MSPHGNYSTPEAVQQAIRDIKQHLEDQDRTYAERRKEDDRREERSARQRQELLDRVDAHGKRTTVLETRHDAFFGDQGAYRLIVAKGEENSKKLDRLFWAILTLAMGVAGSLLKSAIHL